jgi:chromate transporter
MNNFDEKRSVTEAVSQQKPDILTPPEEMPSLTEMAWRFFKIGMIGFGGGMAIIALMERECVRRHHCIESEEFLHGVGLGQLLGTFATNAALFIGYRVHGILGGLVTATAFLLPSIALVIALSWLYFTYHTIPALQQAQLGVGPVVIALIVSSALGMGIKTIRAWSTMLIGVLACITSLLHVNPVLILLMAGAIGLTFKLRRSAPVANLSAAMLFNPSSGILSTKVATTAGLFTAPVIPFVSSIGLLGLAVTFFKIGLVFFGGGFALIPVLHHQLVTDLGWLTQREFVDGVAISQLTPGPIAVLATFAGYHAGGIMGALVATIALFAPSFVLMLIISHFYQRLRHLSAVRDFLAGISPAVVGLIIAAAVALAPGALSWQHPASIVLALAALWLLTWRQWHPAIVIGLGVGMAFLAPSFFQ